MAEKPPPGHFVLLYFASAATFTMKQSEYLPAPLAAPRLFQVLEGRYPGIRQKVLSSCAVTVNLEYVDLDEGDIVAATEPSIPSNVIIKEGDEVAIIPPVSSG